jgi:hypothetical protein
MGASGACWLNGAQAISWPQTPPPTMAHRP